MKKLSFSILTLGIVTVGSYLFKTEPASAYCVYNDSGKTITALQLPVDADSFKQVIDPGSKKCCNWQDDSCTADQGGRYGKTAFVLYEGALDTDAITASEILEDINRIAFQIVDAVAGTFGIPPVSSILVDKIYDQLGSYASKDQGLGVVRTYNGGVISYDGGEPFGCWVGPCQAQNTNYDGSKGIKQ